MTQKNKKFINMLITNGAAIVSVLSFKSIIANEELNSAATPSPIKTEGDSLASIPNVEKSQNPFLNSPNYFTPRHNLDYMFEPKKQIKAIHKPIAKIEKKDKKGNSSSISDKPYISAVAATFMLLACIRKKLTLKKSLNQLSQTFSKPAQNASLMGKFKK